MTALALPNDLLGLARRAIAAHVGAGGGSRAVEPPNTEVGPPSQGVFVTLWSPGHRLRGCVGRMQPACGNLFSEVASCAVAAASRDPRFPPLSAEELDGLDLEISLLGPEEMVDDEEALDPKKYGVVVRSGRRTGVLLPQVDGVESAREQVDIALSKGGLDRSHPYEMSRFEVVKLREAEA